MTWVLVLALAVAALAAAALLLRVERRAWSALGAALALGLAGYAVQANPGVPAAPAASREAENEIGWALIDARRAMVAEEDRSRSRLVVSADAFARQGRYASAVALLNGAVQEHPEDAEAWLALGNALVEHADGALTPASLYAWRRAAEADAEAAGPGYFLGLALIRQGRMGEARAVWSDALERVPPDAAGRAQLEALLARLDQAIQSPPVAP